MKNNKLLQQYYNMQNRNIPYQNNALLQDMMQKRQHMQNMQRQYAMSSQMNQNMQRLKQLQELQRLNRLNEIDKMFDKESLREQIIKPVIDKVSKEEKVMIEDRYSEADNDYNDKEQKTLKKLWKTRTNEGYKNIITDKQYIKSNYKDEDDLIVHKVTDLDKDEEKFEEELEEKNKNVEKHDDELKMIYSISKKASHKKEFDYNHRYKYRVKFTTKTGEDVRQDRIEAYKEKQKESERDKKRVEDIIEEMINTGTIDKEEFQKMGITYENDMIDIDIEQFNKETNNQIDKYNKKKENKINKKDNNDEDVNVIVIKKKTGKK